MERWERPAREACARYRGHCDYEDLLAVARIAAWQDPDYSFVAAKSAVADYLRRPMNWSRARTRSGHALPQPLPLYAEEVVAPPSGDDPERQVIARLWVEWLIGHPCLTPGEQQVLLIWTLTGMSLTEISRSLDRSANWAWNMHQGAVGKLRKVLGGEYVPRRKPQRASHPRFQKARTTREQVLALRETGLSLRDIARRVGCSYPTAQRYAREV